MLKDYFTREKQAPRLAGLLIDMQPEFLKEMAQEEKRKEILEAQERTIRHFAQQGIPLAVIEYNRLSYQQTTQELDKALSEMPKDKIEVIEKSSDSCFRNILGIRTQEGKRLNQLLDRWNANTLCLMGIYSPKCVFRTGEDAPRKYRLITSRDLIAGEDREETEFGEEKLAAIATVYDTADSIIRGEYLSDKGIDRTNIDDILAGMIIKIASRLNKNLRPGQDSFA